MKIEESMLRKIIAYSVSKSLCYNCGFHETIGLLSGKNSIVKDILEPPEIIRTIEEKEWGIEYSASIPDKRWLESLRGDNIIGTLHTHLQDTAPTEDADLMFAVELEKLWGHPTENLIVTIPDSIIDGYTNYFKSKRWSIGPFAWWLNLKDIRLKRRYSAELYKKIKQDYSSYLCAYLSDGSLKPIEIV